MAPLDWGLGHATRCIPIIRSLLTNGFEVILAGEGAQMHLLQTEFPNIPFLPLPGYRVKYSKKPALLALMLMRQLPGLVQRIRRENRWLQRIIEEHQIDLVISDNRYGLYSNRAPCIFITHQLCIKAPFAWAEYFLQRINYRYINRFTACWVPDGGGQDNLAGALSHPQKMPSIPVHYLGLLSRFKRETVELVYDQCIILSGPEPQRSMLEEKVLNGIKGLPGKTILVRGKPGSTENLILSTGIEVYNHLPQDALQKAIQQSRYVVSRTGYTTVMELLSIGKKSILVPTPGQTEQEYLGEHLRKLGYAYTVNQNDFDLAKDLAAARKFSYIVPDVPICSSEKIVELVAVYLRR